MTSGAAPGSDQDGSPGGDRRATRRGALAAAAGMIGATVAAGLDDAQPAVAATGPLTPTPVQRSDYAASVNDLVLVDASTASVRVTLPAAPPDGSQVAVRTVAITTASTVTVLPGGTLDTFNATGGPMSLDLSSPSQSVLLQYRAGVGIWYVIAGAVSLGVGRAAARLGTDGTVGGPSGSPLSGSVALVAPASAPTVPDLLMPPPSGDASGARDTAALRAAVSALARTGGTIRLATGTYLFDDEIVLPNSNADQPAITLRGTGRYSTTLSWPTDLGPGRYALRAGDVNGFEAGHRARELGLRGPQKASFANPNGMDGLALGSGGCAEDVLISGFRAGLYAPNGNQRYENVRSVGNRFNVYTAANIGSGDVSFTDCDFAGATMASFGVASGSQLVVAFYFRRCHFGFAPVGIHLEDGEPGNAGIGFCQFIDVGFESCGNYLIHCPAGTNVVVKGCRFEDCGGTGYGNPTYQQPSLGQTALIDLAGGSWTQNIVTGVDSLSSNVIAGNDTYLRAGTISLSSWDLQPGLLASLRSMSKPFARSGGNPSGVEFSDGLARMRIRRASAPVAQDTVVAAAVDQQVQPMSAAGAARAEGIAKLPATAGDCIPVAYEGRTQALFHASAALQTPLVPAPADPDRLQPLDLATAGTRARATALVGWLQDPSASADGSAFIELTPGFIPPSIAAGRATLSAGTSGAIAAPAVTAASLIRLSNTAAQGTVGALSVTLHPGTGFTINSTSKSDASAVFWEIVQY